MEFNPQDLIQGNKNKIASEETEDSFATDNGAAHAVGPGALDKTKGTRMAGQVGAFALKLMNDPAAQAVNQGWMSKFGMSNQGMQWNQAKMMMSQPQKPQQGK